MRTSVRKPLCAIHAGRGGEGVCLCTHSPIKVWGWHTHCVQSLPHAHTNQQGQHVANGAGNAAAVHHTFHMSSESVGNPHCSLCSTRTSRFQQETHTWLHCLACIFSSVAMCVFPVVQADENSTTCCTRSLSRKCVQHLLLWWRLYADKTAPSAAVICHIENGSSVACT